MIASVLVLPLAALAAQGASDTTRASREAFTGCLRAYVNRAVDQAMIASRFAAEYPRQCTQQEAAYRQAIIQRESALRATRATAEESADEEIEDARANFRESYELAFDDGPPTGEEAPPAEAPAETADPAPETEQPAEPE